MKSQKIREEEYNWQVEYGVLELPLEITKCDKISILKKLLKKWIRTNIPLEKND